VNEKPILIKFEYSEKSGGVRMTVADATNNTTITCYMPVEDAEQLINSFTIALYEAKKEATKGLQ